MTKQEKIIVSVYTGTLMCDFGDVHEYIEKKLGRPVYTHELADKNIQKEIEEKSKEDFLEICKQEEPEQKTGKWIPATEKLPEKDGKYLVWAVISYTPDHVDESCEYQQIAIASFLSGKYGSDFYGNNIEKVIAWMPIPEPYVPQESEDKE